MKRIERILASNQIDKHGDIIPRSALESMASLLERNYLTTGVEHDPRIRPVGRIVEARIEDRPGGLAVLHGVIELFENGDKLPVDIEKTIVQQSYEANQLQVVFDRSYQNEKDLEQIKEIANQFGSVPQFEAKKALEPLSILTIGGAFALGSIASGFFREIGSDSYKWLKNKLCALITNQRTKSKEQLLIFAFTINFHGNSVLIQTILSNPKDEDIENFFKDAIYRLDEVPGEHFDPAKHLSRLVYFYENGKLEFKYAVRTDGFPVTYHVSD